jgi:hypothetical protein
VAQGECPPAGFILLGLTLQQATGTVGELVRAPMGIRRDAWRS